MADNDDRLLSSKRSKFTESNDEIVEDRLSELPDPIILHILSSVCTKQAAQTSLLSKRWQFLWTDLPVIDLRENSREIEVIHRFVDCVRRILITCCGIHVKKFSIDFWYKKRYACDVSRCIRFAVKNKVKDFTLHCRSGSSRDVYVLPPILYSNVLSLTNLAVGGCKIVPERAIKWGCLKSLLIESVELQEFVIKTILSGCSVLEVLQLKDCWGFDRLDVPSPSIATLVIDGWRNTKLLFFLEILAPYVRALSVSDDKAAKFVVGPISSLVTAKVDYSFPEEDPASATSAEVDFMLLPRVQELLESFRSVKKLELGPLCIEVLASLEEMGWHIAPSTRLCLTLTAWRLERSIHGILKILESSPNLETLAIRWTSFERHLISASVYSQKGKLDLVLPHLCHLKYVNIRGLSETSFVGEPMLTLVQLLLKSAPSLEQMVISAEDLIGYSPTSSSSTGFSKVALKLLSFPRASPKAIVVIR